MYGFSKIKSKDGYHEFRHPDFVRGQIKRLANIKRKLNDSQAKTHENSAEYKNLLFEYNRMKKCTNDFEESLKVLVKQNKKLMEANRQLVYQFYYFKKESDLKTKKVLFLFYSLLVGAFPEAKEHFQRHFSNLINFKPEGPPQIIDQNSGAQNENYLMESANSEDDFINDLDLDPKAKRVKKIPNPRLLYQELESRTDSENNPSKKNIIQRMMEQLFKSENGREQFIDSMIKEYLKQIENKERNIHESERKSPSVSNVQMRRLNQPSYSQSIQNRTNYLSDDLDLNGINSNLHRNNASRFEENFTENLSGRFSSRVPTKNGVNSTNSFKNQDIRSQNNSQNYEELLDSIEDKLNNFNFYNDNINFKK